MQPRKPSEHIVGEPNNHKKVLKDIYKVLRGNVSFGQQGSNPHDTTIGLVEDNMDGVFAHVDNTGFANLQFIVDHTLNRVPIGYFVIRQDHAGSFYDSGTDWTETQIFLKCDANGVEATFFIF